MATPADVAGRGLIVTAAGPGMPDVLYELAAGDDRVDAFVDRLVADVNRDDARRDRTASRSRDAER